MKTEIKKREHRNLLLPCLMVSKINKNLIVLFVKPNQAIILSTNNDLLQIGQALKETEIENFDVFDGELTLSN